MGFIRSTHRGKFEVDADQKLGSLISNAIILSQLEAFFAACAPGEYLVDIGCGTRPYAILYQRHFRLAFGFDVSTSPHDLSLADFLAEAPTMPLPASLFDCALCTEVLEHVPEPGQALNEIARVLKPGGWLVLTVPLLLGLHEEPYDYYRYTVHGLRYLLSRAGFEVERVQTKGEMLAVVLSTLIGPWLKLWFMVSKLTRQSWLYSGRNPVLWFTVILPQLFYLAWFQTVQRYQHAWPGRLYRRLEYVTLGYVVIARRMTRISN